MFLVFSAVVRERDREVVGVPVLLLKIIMATVFL
jgi:hypothetical protein